MRTVEELRALPDDQLSTMTPEEFQTLVDEPYYPSEDLIEREARAARRMIHAVDPTFALHSPEPFDVTAETAILRSKVIEIALADEQMPTDFLRFLHPDPETAPGFDDDVFRETIAIADAIDARNLHASPVTTNVVAQLWPLTDVMIHAMSEEEAMRAYDDAAAPGDGPLDVKAAGTVRSKIGFFYYEYSDVFERRYAAEQTGS